MVGVVIFRSRMGECGVRVSGACFSTLAIMMASPATAQDISDSAKTAIVPFADGVGDREGYFSASARVVYKLIVCQGEVHIAYGLHSTTPEVSEGYNFGNRAGTVTSPPPKLSTIRLSGFVSHAGGTLGHVEDEATGPALGFGCYSGQTKKLAMLRDLPGYQATMSPKEISALLSRYVISPVPLEQTLKNSGIRSPAEPSRAVGRKSLSVAGEARGRSSNLPAAGARAASGLGSVQNVADASNKPANKRSIDGDGQSKIYVLCATTGALSPYMEVHASEDELTSWNASFPGSARGYTISLARIFWLNAMEDGVERLSASSPKRCASFDNMNSSHGIYERELRNIAGTAFKIVKLRDPGGDLPNLPFKIDVYYP